MTQPTIEHGSKWRNRSTTHAHKEHSKTLSSKTEPGSER